jgi:MYXO-CTERM domain-containing protein
MTSISNRTTWMLLTGLACFLAAGAANAQSNPATCVNDTDCVATPQCGGDICDWSNAAAGMKCKPAGTQPKGSDGWCTSDDNCKCKGAGATCVNAFCTFTRACDAPDAGGCTNVTGTGGSSGTAGTSGGGSSGGGGCSVAPTGPTEASILLVALGLLAFARRRR